MAINTNEGRKLSLENDAKNAHTVNQVTELNIKLQCLKIAETYSCAFVSVIDNYKQLISLFNFDEKTVV